MFIDLRERERERERNQSVASCTCSYWGLDHNLYMCPDQGLNLHLSHSVKGHPHTFWYTHALGVQLLCCYGSFQGWIHVSTPLFQAVLHAPPGPLLRQPHSSLVLSLMTLSVGSRCHLPFSRPPVNGVGAQPAPSLTLCCMISPPRAKPHL